VSSLSMSNVVPSLMEDLTDAEKIESAAAEARALKAEELRVAREKKERAAIKEREAEAEALREKLRLKRADKAREAYEADVARMIELADPEKRRKVTEAEAKERIEAAREMSPYPPEPNVAPRVPESAYAEAVTLAWGGPGALMARRELDITEWLDRMESWRCVPEKTKNVRDWEVAVRAAQARDARVPFP